VPRLPRLLLALIPVTILIVACGGSATPAANAPLTSAGGGVPNASATGGGGATGAPTNPPGGGGGANAGIPTIADGTYASGTAHVEISGGRNDTFDVDAASGITAGGNTILAFTGADNQKVVQLSFLAPGQGTPGGLSVATNVSNAVFAMAGTWGGECQVKITRNNSSGLSGEFSCKDAPGLAGVIGGKFNIKGTFAAER
jgi:hypothetical protein